MKRWVYKVRCVLAIALAIVFLFSGSNVVDAFSRTAESKPVSQEKINGCPEVTYVAPYIKNGLPDPNGTQTIGSYDLIVQWYQDLEKKYPNYIEVWSPNQKYSLGQIPSSSSHAPYDMYYVRVTNESLGFHKPEVFFMGNPHGDETPGPISTYWFVNWLMRYAFLPECQTEQSAWLRWILDNREIYIGVTHNPDGWDRDRRGEGSANADLNRDADFECCSQSTWPDPFHSVNGKTASTFINKHQIRVGNEFHSGTVMLLYPWGVIGSNIQGTSRISGHTYSYLPPDFYFFDAATLRLGKYVGSYQGSFDASNTGPPADILYQAYGTYLDFGYGSNTQAHPEMASHVQNGPYLGAGIYWHTPEWNQMPKTRPSSEFGTDLKEGWGIKTRRYLLHEIDIAQPYIQWWPGTPENNSQVQAGVPIEFKWVVNGSLVVDNTRIQWATNPADAINNPSGTLPDHTDFQGKDVGGTGWDGATSGKTTPYIWSDKITFQTQGDYYIVARAKVDQIYKDILRPDVYTSGSYLRIVNERTKPGWSETINGDDGTETMSYHEWWYSPILHLKVGSDSTPPTIISTSPKNGDTNVSLNSKIVITFSEAMNQASATGAFSATPAINGTWSWNTQGDTMTLTPGAPMQANQQYQIRISTAAKDLAGNPMSSDYTFSFTTSQQSDTTPPTIKSTDPQNGATGVSVKTSVSITFSEAMDKPTAESAYTINPSDGGHTITWNGDTMVVTPASELSPLTLYTVTVAKSASDLAGNPMSADYTFSFTTGNKSSDTTPPYVTGTDPSDLETDVPTNKQITVFFSEAMKKPETEGAFRISPNVTGTFTWSRDDTMIFIPGSNLQPTTSYQVTITTGALDLAGNNMVTGFSFTFTTGTGPDTTPPRVVDTIPLNGASDVPPEITIAIKFSELMNQQSVEASFTLDPPPIKGYTLGWSGETLFCGPNEVGVGIPGLKENTKYTVTITTGAKDRAGLPLQSTFTMSFTTRMQTPPMVMSTEPADGEDNVSLNAPIKVKFSKEMDISSVRSAFSISPKVAGTFSFEENNSLMIFTPEASYAKGMRYTVTIDRSAKDTSGNAMKYSHVFTFTTEGYTPGGSKPKDIFTDPIFFVSIILVVTVVSLIVILALYRSRKRKRESQMALQQQYYMQQGYYDQGGYFEHQGEGPPPGW